MQLIIGIIIRLVAAALPSMAWGLLRGMGFAAISYVGVSTAISGAKTYVMSHLTSLDPGWVQIAGLLQLDVCISIYFSAYVARAVMWGMNKAGSKTSIRWQPK